MNIIVYYLYHSGFAVDTGNHFLVFDYWKNTPRGAGLDDGVINPSALKDKDVVVFASHIHGDHYNREILGWKDEIPKLRLILSDDIPKVSGAAMIGPHQRLEQPDFVLETLRSTDEGVAFLLEIDGLTVYHAGDLNWWHWEGEPEDYNAGMASNYKAEINRMKGKTLDVAFVPVDPRLGSQFHWGIDYLMKTVEIRYAVPMHFGHDVKVVDRLLETPEAAAWCDRIIPLARRGQSVCLTC